MVPVSFNTSKRMGPGRPNSSRENGPKNRGTRFAIDCGGFCEGTGQREGIELKILVKIITGAIWIVSKRRIPQVVSWERKKKCHRKTMNETFGGRVGAKERKGPRELEKKNRLILVLRN